MLRGYPDWSRGIWIALEGVALPASREGAALAARDKDFYLEVEVAATTVTTVEVYTVPSDKTLFITDFHVYVTGTPYYAMLLWYTGTDFYRFGYISHGGTYYADWRSFSKPVRVPPNGRVRLELWNGDSTKRYFYAWIGGMEADLA